ncbi:unnamed protein product [Brachionus calyciflorus]|uniref:Reverse transcriptase domain-containing protein n=1 Tax=Brachionus calyciflorus TaxID=104777 RepID=A0A814LII9_9BILA|nr:unnamed protein product [Brachionus calyciflorus]
MLAKQEKPNEKIKYRFLVGMRKGNEITKKDSFPLPRMDQALDSLGGWYFFTVMDMSRDYFQVPLKKKDREKPHLELTI